MSSEQIHKYLCIGCPVGCRLEVAASDAGEVVRVEGWRCTNGEAYGAQEHADPRRNVATSICIKGARWKRVPVRTSAPIPKHMVREVARLVQAMEIEAPVAMGTVVVVNVLDTGVDIIVARDMAPA